MPQAVAFGQQRVDHVALTRRQTEIPTFVRDFSQKLLRAEQGPVQDPAALLPHQGCSKIWNPLLRWRRLIANNRYAPLPGTEVALQADLQPGVRCDNHVEVPLHLEATSPTLLFGVEPVAADQALQNRRTFGAQEIGL